MVLLYCSQQNSERLLRLFVFGAQREYELDLIAGFRIVLEWQRMRQVSS